MLATLPLGTRFIWRDKSLCEARSKEEFDKCFPFDAANRPEEHFTFFKFLVDDRGNQDDVCVYQTKDDIMREYITIIACPRHAFNLTVENYKQFV